MHTKINACIHYKQDETITDNADNDFLPHFWYSENQEHRRKAIKTAVAVACPLGKLKPDSLTNQFTLAGRVRPTKLFKTRFSTTPQTSIVPPNQSPTTNFRKKNKIRTTTMVKMIVVSALPR